MSQAYGRLKGIHVKKPIIIGLLILALAASWRLPIISATSETGGFVCTANERGNSISAIDVGAGQVKNIVTHITPHNVQASRDGRLLLVVGPVTHIMANQPPMETMAAIAFAASRQTRPKE